MIFLLYIIPLVLGYLIEYRIAGSTRHFSIVPLIPILNVFWIVALIGIIIHTKREIRKEKKKQ